MSRWSTPPVSPRSHPGRRMHRRLNRADHRGHRRRSSLSGLIRLSRTLRRRSIGAGHGTGRRQPMQCHGSREAAPEICRNRGQVSWSQLPLGPVSFISLDDLEKCERQSVRRRRPFVGFDQRRGATQPLAGLRRCSSGLAGDLRRSGPCCMPGLHRTELDRYTAQESAQQAGSWPDFC